MQFNSIAFMFCFLPLFLAVYYFFPQRKRAALLVAGSLIFYFQAGTDPYLTVLLLLVTMLYTHLIARLMERRWRTAMLAAGLGALALELIFFKLYSGGKYLPTGMSFYIFQMAAYLVDVYRGRIEADQNLTCYAAQTMMFPKLLMGPLMDPAALQSQVRKPDNSWENFHSGLQKLILGLALKVVLANRVGGLWSQAATIGYESISTPFAWLSLLAYAMKLYYDFWSYSMMAQGIGLMLGFHLPDNFLDPYTSRSVSEFWRRWHASLGAWFREYLYIPLGGNRKGTLRTVLNLAVVWLFTGLWHGVGGNYLLWALILFFFVINERFWLRRYLDQQPVLAHIYTVIAILISWIPFAIGDWSQMTIFVSKIFACGSPALNPTDFVVWGKEYLWLLIAGVFFATTAPRKLWSKIKDHPATDVFLFALFWVAVYYIATSAQDPFMYFQY